MSRTVISGNREYFPGIAQIQYEGPGSDNLLSFKAYQPNRIIAGRSMEEHLRFAVCYWHTFHGTGNDPFGPGTRDYAWNHGASPMDAARNRLDAAFEFFSKMNVPFYCFHDRDLAPEGDSVAGSEKNLQDLTEMAAERQQETGLRLLWGTANLFTHPRYMNGAATNPQFDVLAHGGAQVKAALDATVALGGENYVLWGGREGYTSLMNTNTHRELEHFARFLEMVRDYGRSIGFKGTFLIEPKPMEPMYHQYDHDSQTVIGFLRHHGLAGDYKVNVEANHATLAGHSFWHELRMSSDAGLLGSVDANCGNPQNGWDTDQFPMNLYDCAQAMLVILGQGGLGGGLNFDAKLRRESVDLEDLFLAHIGGMDSFARGLIIADRVMQDSRFTELCDGRYASFNSGPGLAFERGKLSLADLRDHAASAGEPAMISAKQELLENLFNDHMMG